MSNLGLAKDEIVNLNGSLNILGETIKTSISILEESFKPLSGCLDEICGQLSEINTGLESLGSSEGLTSFGEGLNIVLGMIVSIFDLIRDAGGIKEIGTALATAFTGAGEAATGMGTAILGATGLAAPELALIAAAIAAVAGIIIICWDEVKEIAGQIGGWLNESFLVPLQEMLGPAIDFVWEGHIKPLWEKMKSFAESLKNAVMIIWNNFLAPIAEFLVNNFYPPIANGIGTLGEILATFVAFIADLFRGLIEFFQGIIDFFAGVFSGDMDMVLRGIIESLCGLVDFFGGIVVGFINLIIDALNFVFNWIVGIINKLGNAARFIGNIFGQDWGWEFNIKSPLKKIEFSGLADGGIPGYGELFIAREAGPEFVGSFGSRNVVMNNNQIVDAVSGGVYDAVRRANAEQSQQPIYLNVEAKVRENVLFDMMETVRAERGVRLSTGGAWHKKSIRNTLFHIATEMPKGGVRHKAGQLPWPPLAKSIILFHSLHIT